MSGAFTYFFTENRKIGNTWGDKRPEVCTAENRGKNINDSRKAVSFMTSVQAVTAKC